MAVRIVFVCVGLLAIMCLVSFFVTPAYEKGVWFVLGAVGAALSGALGFLFGVTVPRTGPAAAGGPEPLPGPQEGPKSE